MKMALELTPDEFDTCQKLEALGWKRPPNVTIGLPPSPTTDGGGIGAGAGAVAPVVPAPPSMPAGSVTVGGGGTVSAAGGVTTAAQSGFNEIFPWVIQWEGGYTNDPNDPGGPTKYGIDTKDDSKEWMALGVKDIKDLTLDQAQSIYKAKYWDGTSANWLPEIIGQVYFNYAVNVGAVEATRLLQSSLGNVKIDGDLGPLTRASVGAVPESLQPTVALGMIDAADKFYKVLATQERFSGDLQGWLNRNNSLREFVKKA